MIEETGDQKLFLQYVRTNNMHEIEREMQPYLEKMPRWLAVYSKSSGRIRAVTPVNDNSANPPEGNRRVKPSSGLMPLADSYESARFLIDAWERLHPNATRFCEVRLPVDDVFGSKNVSRALTDAGYRIEAIMPNLFTIDGKEYTVNDYARNKPERLSEFPERSTIMPRLMQDVFWNEQVRPLLTPEIERLCRNINKNYLLYRARPEDAQEIVSLMGRAFRNYGTFDIATAMPAMLEDNSPTAPIVYVARATRVVDNEPGDKYIPGFMAKMTIPLEVVATGTIERSSYGFGEFTDMAVDENFGNTGIATALGYRAMQEARRRGLRHYWTDSVPYPAISKVIKRMGAIFRGVHENQVRIMTHQLYEIIRRDPDSLDLMVCSGAL